MSDIIKNLSNMLGEDKIPENIKEVLNNVNTNENNNSTNPSFSPEMLSNLVNAFNNSSSNNSSNPQANSSDFSNIDLEMLLKMKDVMNKVNSNKNDPRANLLRSLKPYLNENRQTKVEQYVKLFSMTKIIDIFNTTGGDHSNA